MKKKVKKKVKKKMGGSRPGAGRKNKNYEDRTLPLERGRWAILSKIARELKMPRTEMIRQWIDERLKKEGKLK
jgi:hypothetical protein